MPLRPPSACASGHRAARGRAPGEPDRAWAVRALGRWYDNNARDLPWRHTTDPYAIWISEIMLQQTRVEAVVPFALSTLARHVLATARERREGTR